MKSTKLIAFFTSIIVLFSLISATACSAKNSVTDDSENIKLGDVNFDATLNVLDVTLIRAYIVQNISFDEKQIIAGDINSDTVVDISDVVKLRYAVVNVLSLGFVSYKDSTTSVTTTITTPNENSDDVSKRIYVNGTKFMVGEKEIWINGANTPWDNWNDFGGDFDYEFWDSHFADLHDGGINATRVWISCNGDVGMNFDSDGYFTGATDQYWEDLGDLFEIAEKHEVYIMATLMSFDHFKNKTKTYWRNMLQDSAKIDSYVDNFVKPLLEKHGDNEYLWSIDLCNEPDWIYENKECGKIDWKYISEYFARATAAIHENSDVLVTVGIAYIKYNSDRSGCEGNKVSDSYLQSLYNNPNAYLDFYSTHYYSWMKQWYGDPFEMSSIKEYGVDNDRPFVMGETAAVGAGHTLLEEYEAAYKNGWNGIMAWKTSGQSDGCGLLPDTIKATVPMANKLNDLVFPYGK